MYQNLCIFRYWTEWDQSQARMTNKIFVGLLIVRGERKRFLISFVTPSTSSAKLVKNSMAKLNLIGQRISMDSPKFFYFELLMSQTFAEVLRWNHFDLYPLVLQVSAAVCCAGSFFRPLWNILLRNILYVSFKKVYKLHSDLKSYTDNIPDCLVLSFQFRF